jgi:hypothetical protein
MHRLGLIVVLAAAAACEPATSSTPPEPTPAAATAESPSEPEPESAPAPEPESAPEPEPAPEVSKIDEPVYSKEGFEARDLHCTLETPTRGAAGYIAAGLVDADATLDACAPKGAAVEVSWAYISSMAQNVSVEAETSSLANCVMTAMASVRAGVDASCSAVLLIGDPAAAAAAYDAR